MPSISCDVSIGSLLMVCGGAGGVIVAPRVLVVDTLTTDGTWTAPAGEFWAPDGTPGAVQIELWAAGAGGTSSVGGGGGGAYSRGNAVPVSPSTGYAVAGLAGGAVASNAANATFDSSVVVAQGGQAGAGGAGGSAAAGTGNVKFSGGAGSAGGASVPGGGGAGSTENGGAGSGGSPDGGFSAANQAGRPKGGGGGSGTGSQQLGGRGEFQATYLVAAQAGFPRIVARAAARDGGNLSSRPGVLPSGIAAGDLLLLLVPSDGVPTITDSSGNFTALDPVTEGTSQVAGRLFYRVATGDASDAATIATSAAEQVTQLSWLIKGAGIPAWTTASGSSTNADSPDSPAGAVANRLFISVVGWDASSAFDITGTPANYRRGLTAMGIGIGGTVACAAERYLAAASDNPGAWASGVEQWVAGTISVPPA